MKINKHKGTSLIGSVPMATASTAVTPFVVTSHIPENKIKSVRTIESRDKAQRVR